MDEIFQIHKILLKAFGPQYWWPVTKEKEIAPKYHKKINNNEPPHPKG